MPQVLYPFADQIASANLGLEFLEHPVAEQQYDNRKYGGIAEVVPHRRLRLQCAASVRIHYARHRVQHVKPQKFMGNLVKVVSNR